MKFLGHILCPKDGYTYIKDPKQVVIYYTPDSAYFATEVICEKCGSIVNGQIDAEFLLAFRSHGVKLLPYGQRFSPLTEEMISEWNIEKELRTLEDDTKHRQY